jgi:hypothetical protein
MSTNRTKIDWAYKQAKQIQQEVAAIVWFTSPDSLQIRRAQNVRKIAGSLRRAEKRGRVQGMRSTEPIRDRLARRQK